MTETPISPEASPPERSALLTHVPIWLSFWVPIVTALASLALSLYTFAVTMQNPDMLVVMPDVVRIAQGGPSGPLIYAQPVFIGTGMSERVDVVTGIHLRVEPINPSGGSVEFVWDEQGEWVYDPVTQHFNWIYKGDSGAFLVGARNAQDFMGLFIGPQEWRFEPGRYRIVLVADRVTNRQPLSEAIEIVLAPENVEFLNQSQGSTFLTFPAQKLGR